MSEIHTLMISGLCVLFRLSKRIFNSGMCLSDSVCPPHPHLRSMQVFKCDLERRAPCCVPLLIFRQRCLSARRGPSQLLERRCHALKREGGSPPPACVCPAAAVMRPLRGASCSRGLLISPCSPAPPPPPRLASLAFVERLLPFMITLNWQLLTFPSLIPE